MKYNTNIMLHSNLETTCSACGTLHDYIVLYTYTTELLNAPQLM